MHSNGWLPQASFIPLVIALAVIGLGTPTIAVAKCSDSRAKTHYKKGKRVVDRDPARATEHLEKAYRICKNRYVRFYLGLAYANSGRCDDALRLMAELPLELGRSKKARQVAKRRDQVVNSCRATLLARVAVERRHTTMRWQRLAPEVLPTLQTPITFTEHEPIVESSASSPLEAPGWTALGVGAVSLVAGGITWALREDAASDANHAVDRARLDETPLEDIPGLFDEWSENSERADRLETATLALGIAGGAIALTGAVLLVVDATSGPSSSVEIGESAQIEVGVGGFGVSF